MTPSKETFTSQAEFARMADTPMRGRSIYGTRGPDDPQPTLRLRRARNGRKLSELEIECGITHEQYEDIHAAMRASVRARWLS